MCIPASLFSSIHPTVLHENRIRALYFRWSLLIINLRYVHAHQFPIWKNTAVVGMYLSLGQFYSHAYVNTKGRPERTETNLMHFISRWVRA